MSRRPMTADGARKMVRPRINASAAAASVLSRATTLPAHTHAANRITFEPAGNLAGDDVQEVCQEIDVEKLARDGSQEMLGILDMGTYAIKDCDGLHLVGTADIDGAKSLEFDPTAVGEAIISNTRGITFGGTVGEDVVTGPRVINMGGLDSGGEARINDLGRVVFAADPAGSVAENLSRLQWNLAVVPGTHFSPALVEADTFYDLDEFCLTVGEFSGGAVIVPIAIGWNVSRCISYRVLA